MDALKGLAAIKAQIGHPPPNKRVALMVQTRMASSRLPGKAILPLAGMPSWWHIMQRLEYAAKLADLDVAGAAIITTGGTDDDILERQAQRYNYDCVRHLPAWDIPARILKALDFFGCDLYLLASGDGPLSWVDHAPLMRDVVMSVSYGMNMTYRRNLRSGDPLRWVGDTVGSVTLGLRWQQELQKYQARTPDEHEAPALTFIRTPELARVIIPPRESYRDMPEECSHYWRWYSLEVDNPEDGVTMQVLYDKFYKPSGALKEIVDPRQCIEWIDANRDMHYSRERAHSAVNMEQAAWQARCAEQRFLDYCEFYLAPVDAVKYYCHLCGEFMGYVLREHGKDHLYRPDGSTVTGAARVSCTAGHFRMWHETLRRAVSAGSAVEVPPEEAS